MDDGGLRNEVSDGLQVIGPEDGQVLQVGDEEGIGGRSRLLQRWY